MKTRRGAAKKVKRASEQTPDFRHRGKTSGGGHFQGASVFREMQAFFPSVSRLTSARDLRGTSSTPARGPPPPTAALPCACGRTLWNSVITRITRETSGLGRAPSVSPFPVGFTDFTAPRQLHTFHTFHIISHHFMRSSGSEQFQP